MELECRRHEGASVGVEAAACRLPQQLSGLRSVGEGVPSRAALLLPRPAARRSRLTGLVLPEAWRRT